MGFDATCIFLRSWWRGLDNSEDGFPQQLSPLSSTVRIAEDSGCFWANANIN
jgi:hypothetical protein